MRWLILGLIGGGILSGIVSIYHQLLAHSGGNDEATTFKVLMWFLWLIAAVLIFTRAV